MSDYPDFTPVTLTPNLFKDIHGKQNDCPQKTALMPRILNLTSVPQLQSEQTAAGCCLSIIMRREDFSKGYSSEAVVHKHCLMEPRSHCYDDRFTLETGVCARCVSTTYTCKEAKTEVLAKCLSMKMSLVSSKYQVVSL